MRNSKLEEQIALERDPEVRKRLQRLLESRKQKRDELWQKVKERAKVESEAAGKEIEKLVPFMWFIIIAFIILVILAALATD